MTTLTHHPLVLRPANRDGFCPVLQPAECCLDEENAIWHFCTPDDTHFAVESNGEMTRVQQLQTGIRIVPHTPTWAANRAGRVKNKWTVRDGWWEIEE